MQQAQNNQCKICGIEFEKAPNIDHDHATGTVRGLLCQGCNIGLGFFRDDPTLLVNAINYLKET